MYKKRKLILIPLLLIFCIGTVLPVSASDTVDTEMRGSVSVTLKDGDAAVSGAEITLYKVADAGDKDSNLYFEFNEAFAGFGGVPNEIKGEDAVRRLAEYAAKNSVGGKTLLTDEGGFVCFNDLSLGLYLVVQTGGVQGYSDCSPFLISVPAESENEWVYDIDATPKTDIVRLVDISVKKVWNDDGEKRPDSVTIQLLNGDAVAETVTLNEQNNWSCIWESLPKSDAWSVKEINVPMGYTASYQKNGFEYTVINTPTLIQTGQLKWPVPVLAGAGLLLFALGWILYFRGKRKDNA